MPSWTFELEDDRHQAALPAYSAPDGVPAAWSRVEHLIYRLPDEDQDLVDMHMAGVGQFCAGMILGITQAAVSHRILRILLILQHLLCEPPWDRDEARACLLRVARERRDPEAFANAYMEWLTTLRSGTACAASWGIRQDHMAGMWRRTAMSWRCYASPELQEAAEWRRCMPKRLAETPGLRRLRPSPAMAAAVREVLGGAQLAHVARRRRVSYQMLLSYVRRAHWTDRHRPVWLVGPDDPRPP